MNITHQLESRDKFGRFTKWQKVNQQDGRLERQVLRLSHLYVGFFPAETEADRKKSIDDNLALLDQAAELGAPLIVLVCGAIPGQSLQVSRNQITKGIEAILSKAETLGIRLGIEPLHPMYADNRSAITSLGQANDIELLDSPNLGVTIDVYHTWWDPDLKHEIVRCGSADNISPTTSPTGKPQRRICSTIEALWVKDASILKASVVK